MDIVLSALQQGLCYAFVALGVYISYKILDFPDLTVDGSFPLGGIVCLLLIRAGVFSLLAVAVAFVAGAVAGFVTGILHVRFKISNLLSGILVMTGLLSVTLVLTKIPTGFTQTLVHYRPEDVTLFKGGLVGLFGSQAELGKTVVLCALVIACKLLLDLFLKTKTGFLLRAAGNNGQLVTAMGKSVGFYKVMGLMIANGMTALGGAVYAQQMNLYDNTSGTGMVVIALASVIIGVSLLKNLRFVKGTTAVIIGALIYSTCLYVAVLYIDGIYIKLIMAALFAAVLIGNYCLTGRRQGRGGRA